MKKELILLLVISLSLITSKAQSEHDMRPGDIIRYQSVTLKNLKPLIADTADVIVDLSEMKKGERQTTLKCDTIPGLKNIIILSDGNTQYYYTRIDKYVFCTRYENSGTVRL